MSEWISVEDRLPEPTVHAGGKKIAFALFYFYGSRICEDIVVNGNPPDGATHWMPLPEPPNEA